MQVLLEHAYHLGLCRAGMLGRVLGVDDLEVEGRGRLVIDDGANPAHDPRLCRRHVMSDHPHRPRLVLIVLAQLGSVHAPDPPLLVREGLDQLDEALLGGPELVRKSCRTRCFRFSHHLNLSVLLRLLTPLLNSVPYYEHFQRMSLVQTPSPIRPPARLA